MKLEKNEKFKSKVLSWKDTYYKAKNEHQEAIYQKNTNVWAQEKFLSPEEKAPSYISKQNTKNSYVL